MAITSWCPPAPRHNKEDNCPLPHMSPPAFIEDTSIVSCHPESFDDMQRSKQLKAICAAA